MLLMRDDFLGIQGRNRLLKSLLVGGKKAEPPKTLVQTLYFKVYSLLPKGLILYCKVEFCTAV